MTDEEFQRLKEEEKKHLRAKKRLQRTLRALKQRNEAQGVLQRMKRAGARVLDETESFVDSLRRAVAQDQARFEVALSDEMSEAEDLHEAEEALREERAEALLRQIKEEETSSRSRPSISEDDEASEEQPEDAPTQDGPDNTDGPDKTIGRMGDLQGDLRSEES